ncbi:hypothetical protein [Streptosporangium sp. CA-115845]|uniref:hypothetical protein n=1 Tax=Streptosporangium sp. CA-115845 TaxID=3240071 RepID=UPI003D8EBAF2
MRAGRLHATSTRSPAPTVVKAAVRITLAAAGPAVWMVCTIGLSALARDGNNVVSKNRLTVLIACRDCARPMGRTPLR